MLKYISYVSEQSYSLSEMDIEQLLHKSRCANTTKGITGILIFFEGVFTQFLEGPEQAIDSLYEKIRLDKRHKEMRELFSGTSPDRFYGDWSMAYKPLDNSKAMEITGYRTFDKTQFFAPIDKEQNHPGVLLLESFVNGLHFF